MGDDILNRLKKHTIKGRKRIDGRHRYCTLCDIIHEIEQLRAENERLRAAGDALAATWPEEDRCGCDNKDCRAVVKAFAAWQEARRA